MTATVMFRTSLSPSLRSGEARRPSAPAHAVPSLSPREREVLQWCAQGKTSWEIALILGITERTVNFHIYQAADKFGTRGRSATCLQAALLGLISP